jgi:4-diphosphocytidyl-2C-methyl-D-erythritol kinase
MAKIRIAEVALADYTIPDGADFPTFISFLTDLAKKTGAEDLSQVTIDTAYIEDGVESITFQLFREETEEEEQARLTAARRREAQAEARERRQYESLRAKFEGKE